MKKILLLSLSFITISAIHAQVDTATTALPMSTTPPKPKKSYNLSNRANDHFMLQVGYLMWAGRPDSIQTSGIPRSINVYFMLDFPFKSSPKFSAALGLGIGSDHMTFTKSFPDVNGTTSTLRFNGPEVATFKRTKLATVYLEAPIELRYISNPENSNKSFKAALGVKVGTMLKSGTRSRSNGNPSYIEKTADKRYFNTFRVAGTARIGYGNFSVFGTYQFTNLLTNTAGPQLHPFTIGLTISGL